MHVYFIPGWRTRIRIDKLDPDPDPHWSEKLRTDTHWNQSSGAVDSLNVGVEVPNEALEVF